MLRSLTKSFFTQIIYTRSISDKRLSDIDFTDEPVVKHNVPDVNDTNDNNRKK